MISHNSLSAEAVLGQGISSLQSTESFGLEAFFFLPVKNPLQMDITSGLCTDSYPHRRSWGRDPA